MCENQFFVFCLNIPKKEQNIVESQKNVEYVERNGQCHFCFSMYFTVLLEIIRHNEPICFLSNHKLRKNRTQLINDIVWVGLDVLKFLIAEIASKHCIWEDVFWFFG